MANGETGPTEPAELRETEAEPGGMEEEELLLELSDFGDPWSDGDSTGRDETGEGQGVEQGSGESLPCGQESARPSPHENLHPDGLQRLEEAVGKGFASLSEAFEAKLAYDRCKEEQIDRLHEELQEQRKDLLARTQWPLLQGLIRLHDQIGRTAEALARKPSQELTQERWLQVLDEFSDDLKLLLEHHGVHTFQAPNEEFDPRRQTAARRVETTDSEQVGRLAGRLRPGFEQGAALLQKERVAVYVAAPSQPKASSPASGGGEPSQTQRVD